MRDSAGSAGRLPPGPKGRKLHNIRQRLSRHSEFMDELHAEYGDIVFFEIPARNCAAVFSAELIHEVLVEQEPYFQPYYPKTSYNLIQSPCLAISRFETHTELEKVMAAAFTPERMPAYGKAIIDNALTFRERLASNGKVDFKDEAERYTWGSLLDAVIGVDFKVEPELGKSVLDAMKSDLLLSLLPFGLALKRLPLPHNVRTARQIKALDEQTYRSIERARDPDHNGDNVISHFVRAADEGVVDWDFPDDSEIRDEAYTLMFGAVDAPTGTLTHAVHFLARNPAARERLEQEVDQALDGRSITLADVDRLPYAHAVFKETLRLEPPAYVLIPRETLEDRVVGGYLVPKGTLMNVCMRVMQRRQDYFDDAGEFRPERWLEDAEQGGSRCPAHSYLPFSTKPRICQGEDFARLLFVSGLASLVQELRVEPESEQPPTKTNIGVGIMGKYLVDVHKRSRRRRRVARQGPARRSAIEVLGINTSTHEPIDSFRGDQAMSNQLPPGPSEGKLKTMRRMMDDYIGFFHGLHDNYGDMVYFELPTSRHCAVFNADVVEELLVEKTDVLKVLHPRTSFEVMQAPCLARMPAGEEQGRLKNLLRSAYTPERTRALKQVAADEANHLAGGLEEGSVDFRGRLERFTFNALTMSIIGGGRELSLEVALPTLKAVKLNFIVFAMPGYSLLRKLPLPHDMKARKAIRALDEVTYASIAAARSSDTNGTSLISHLVQATARGESDWNFRDDSEIRDEAYGMIFGALDGPVHALTHAPYHLAWNPEVRERLEAEVQQVVGERPLAGEDLDRLPYAHAVCKELLRLHPPAPLLVPREAVEDTTLGGYFIPKGTLVDLVIHVMHRRSDYWEDTEAFRPERWLNGGQECPRNGFIPFSIAPKECGGGDLATAIIVSALAAVAQRWRVEPESDEFPPAGLGAGAFSGAVSATVTSRTA